MGWACRFADRYLGACGVHDCFSRVQPLFGTFMPCTFAQCLSSTLPRLVQQIRFQIRHLLFRQVHTSHILIASFCTIAVAIVSTLLLVPMFRFQVPATYGIYLFILYFVFLAVAGVIEILAL